MQGRSRHERRDKKTAETLHPRRGCLCVGPPSSTSGDILEAIDNIEEDTSGISYDEFAADRRRRDAVIRNFQVIGKATRNLPDDLKAAYPETDWKKIVGFRDVLTHACFGIKYMILWDNATNKMPDLKKEIHHILKSEKKRT